MEHFASDGATTPWHGNATFPAAFHDPVSGRTWIAWEALVAGARRVHCTVLDAPACGFEGDREQHLAAMLAFRDVNNAGG